ncbi:major capsid protein [Hydrogenophaga sp. ANAO-22]|uniref:major capsid protein n=1 Tax=Hydrogenophaga sp. ANAO-22 TaxID=3166645 RepID=UPI0036D21774
MKPFNAIKRYGAKVAPKVGAAVLLGSVMVSNALAALDPAIEAEVAANKTDVKDMGALVFGVFLAVVFFNWIRRVTK